MLTPQYLESLIVKEQYHLFDETNVTVCCLTLQNGFSVVGESACLPTTDFKEDVGREVARENAFDQLWKLEGYLATQMHAMSQDPEIMAQVAKLEAEPSRIVTLGVSR